MSSFTSGATRSDEMSVTTWMSLCCFGGLSNQTHNIQLLSYLVLKTTSISSSSAFSQGEQRRQCRAVETGVICQMVRQWRGERWKEKRGKRTAHYTHNRKKQSPNGHVKSLAQLTAHTLSLILTSHCLTNNHHTTEKANIPTQHLLLVVWHILCVPSPHMSTFILSGICVIEWVASPSFSHKDEAECDHACMSVYVYESGKYWSKYC